MASEHKGTLAALVLLSPSRRVHPISFVEKRSVFPARWPSCPRPLAGTVLLGVLVALTGSRVAPRAQAQTVARTVWTQDVWLITDFEAQDANGTTTNLVPVLLAAIDAAPGQTTDLGGGFGYTDAPALTGSAVGSTGTPFGNIGIHVGVLTAPSGRVLTVISTPDVAQTKANIDANSQVGIDLSGVPAAGGATGGAISYSLLQTLQPADPATEAGLDDIGVFAQRFQNGEFQVLGAPDANGDASPAVVPNAPLSPLAAQGSARYAQSGGGVLAWPAYPDPFTAELPGGKPLPDVWSRGKGAVPPGQVTLDNDPLDYRWCIYGCTWVVSGSGSFSGGGGAGYDATITFHGQGTVGFDTQFAFQRDDTVSNPLTETYTPRGYAAGCSFDAGRSKNIDGLAYTGKLVVFANLDHSWVALPSFGGDHYAYLACSKMDPIAHQLIVNAEWTLPSLATYGCPPAVRIKGPVASRPPTDIFPAEGLQLQFTCTFNTSGVYGPGSGSVSVNLSLFR